MAFASSACPETGCTTDMNDFEGMLQKLLVIGAIDAQSLRRLQKHSSVSDRQTVIKAVLSFRDVVVDALASMAAGRCVSDDTLAKINQELSTCGCRRQLVLDKGVFRMMKVFEIQNSSDVLMPLAHSIAELLARVDHSRIKTCREPRCSCYFIDTSKNRTRTWCSMLTCGNRNKVATYYRRSREKETIS
ncbi:MAG: CGNR zinc finger domain-containing protein [Candidatus Eremiobacteraeota bacterium]|nr:CGNR zinc finger domain-containing protein [Candidatus Eremiobacteraeota bacterium]